MLTLKLEAANMLCNHVSGCDIFFIYNYNKTHCPEEAFCDFTNSTLMPQDKELKHFDN